MNKKGNILISIGTGFFIFIAGILLIQFIFPEIDTVRASDILNCNSASTITDGTKLACLGIDLIVPYFILAILSLAGMLIIERFIT